MILDLLSVTIGTILGTLGSIGFGAAITLIVAYKMWRKQEKSKAMDIEAH